MIKGKNLKPETVITGGIYEYVREDNGEVVYRGSSQHETLEKIDRYHREGHIFHKKGKGYSWTCFRSNLRRPFGDNVSIRWLHERKEMTYKDLLCLEADCIQAGHKEGLCYLNHDPDPWKTWQKWNLQS